jgi:hypothetical protein
LTLAKIYVDEYVIDLSAAGSWEEFVEAFNVGFCRRVGGEWPGTNWDAFHDFLAWPKEEEYRLVFKGWEACRALTPENRSMILEILAGYPGTGTAFR